MINFRTANKGFLRIAICLLVILPIGLHQKVFAQYTIKDAFLHRQEINLKTNEPIILQGLETSQSYTLAVQNPENGMMQDIIYDPDQLISHNYTNGIHIIQPKQNNFQFSIQNEKNQYKSNPNTYIISFYKNRTAQRTGSIQTETGHTAQDLIQNVFIGGNCFDVSGVSAPGGALAMGTFSNGLDPIDIEEGVILASGHINIAQGPNTQTGDGSSVGSAGVDPDLADLVGTNSIFDVAIIEFDFIPTEDYVSFDYVFASEEYCDYVNSQFNDVFGFFISGPGINGPFTNNAENIAVIPGTNEYVSINTINWGSYNQYYVDNVPINQPQGSGGCTPAELANPPAAANETELDGFTTVFTAEIEVVPCETYHIKLAIADVADGLFDSAVFLKANSFNAGGGSSVEVGYPDAFATYAYEGCDNAYFYFERADPDVSLPLTINFTILPASTATAGIDYEKLPTSFTIPAGLIGDTLWISIFDDLIIEGVETILLELDNTCSCMNPVVEVQIVEPPAIEGELPDFVFCNPQGITLNPMASGGIPELTYLWDDGSTNPIKLDGPLETTTYNLTITDACDNTLELSSTVTILEQIEASLSGSAYYCSGGNAIGALYVTFTGTAPWNLIYSINGNSQSLFGIEDNPFELPITQPGVYQLLNVNAGDCFGPGLGTIVVPEIELNADFTSAMPYCTGYENGSIDLTVNGTDSVFVYQWEDGSTGEDLQDVGAGVYSVTIEDQSGCQLVDSFEVNDPALLSLTLDSLVGTSCADSTAGIIWVSTEGGTAPYTYSWNDSLFTQEDINQLEAGNYMLLVLDSLGCMDSLNVEVPFLSPDIQIAIGDVDTLNCEVTSAIIEGSVNDTLGNYSFSWTTEDGSIISNPDSSQIEVDKGGTYILTVIDLTFGCSYDQEVNLVATQYPPVAQIEDGGLLTCVTDTILLNGEFSAPGGLIFNWSTPDGNILDSPDSSSIHVNSVGTYILTVFDTLNGCTDTSEIQVLEDMNYPFADAGSEEIFPCFTSSIQLDGSGSSNDTTIIFQWEAGAGANIVNGADTPNPEVDQSGNYYLTITNTSNGCVSVDSVNVLDPVMPELWIAAPEILNCSVINTYLTAQDSAGLAGINFIWSTLDGNIVSDPMNNNIQVNMPGTYIVEVTDPSTNCTDLDSVMVLGDTNIPQFSMIDPDILTCNIPSTILQANLTDSLSDFTVVWFTNSGNITGGINTLLTEADAPGIYYFELTDVSNGCSNLDSVEVSVDPNTPVSLAGPDQNLNCGMTSATLDGTASSAGGQYIYTWVTMDGSITSDIQNPMIDVDAPGTYTLIVTDTLLNCQDSSSVQVFIDTLTPAIILSAPITLNCDQSTGTIINTATNQQNINISWFYNGNPVSGANTDSLEISAGGIYSIVINDPDNLCDNAQEIEVLEDFEIPVLNILPPVELNCLTETQWLEAQVSNSGIFNYTWDTQDGNILQTNGSQIQIDQGGNYQITVTNANNGCTSINSVQVEEDFEIPQIDLFSADTIDCLHPSAFITLQYSSSGQDVNISWGTVNGNILNESDPLNIEVDAGGEYSVSVQDNTNGCFNEGIIEIFSIEASPNAFVTEIFDPGCDGSGGMIQILQVEGGTAPYTYYLNGVSYSDIGVFNDLNPGNYTIEVVDKLGCSYEESFFLPDVPAIDVSLENTITLDLGDEYVLNLETNLDPDEIESIVWSPDDYLSCNDCYNPILTAENDVVIRVIVYDIYGCVDEAEIVIRVVKDAKVYIPNIFSPNSDGINDVVTVFGKETQVIEVQYFAIFDRWGNRVFENDHFKPNDPGSGWNGKYLDRNASLGVYAYIAIVELINGETITIGGDVTLIR